MNVNKQVLIAIKLKDEAEVFDEFRHVNRRLIGTGSNKTHNSSKSFSISTKS